MQYIVVKNLGMDNQFDKQKYILLLILTLFHFL